MRDLPGPGNERIDRLGEAERQKDHGEHAGEHRGEQPRKPDEVRAAEQLRDFVADSAHLGVADDLVSLHQRKFHQVGSLAYAGVYVDVLKFGGNLDGVFIGVHMLFLANLDLLADLAGRGRGLHFARWRGNRNIRKSGDLFQRLKVSVERLLAIGFRVNGLLRQLADGEQILGDAEDIFLNLLVLVDVGQHQRPAGGRHGQEHHQRQARAESQTRERILQAWRLPNSRISVFHPKF